MLPALLADPPFLQTETWTCCGMRWRRWWRSTCRQALGSCRSVLIRRPAFETASGCWHCTSPETTHAHSGNAFARLDSPDLTYSSLSSVPPAATKRPMSTPISGCVGHNLPPPFVPPLCNSAHWSIQTNCPVSLLNFVLLKPVMQLDPVGMCTPRFTARHRAGWMRHALATAVFTALPAALGSFDTL